MTLIERSGAPQGRREEACATPLAPLVAAARLALRRARAGDRAGAARGRGWQGARAVFQRASPGFVGVFHSRRFGPLPYAGNLARDFLRLLECDPVVAVVLPSPFAFDWVGDDGRAREHAPALAVERGGRVALVDFARADAAARPAVRARTALFARAFAEHGIAYELVTEREARAEPRLANACLLLQGAGYRPTPDERSDVLALVARAPGGLTDRALAAALGRPPDFANAVRALVLEGALRLAHPDRPIPEDGRLVLPETGR